MPYLKQQRDSEKKIENRTWWDSNNAWLSVFAQRKIIKWSICIIYKKLRQYNQSMFEWMHKFFLSRNILMCKWASASRRPLCMGISNYIIQLRLDEYTRICRGLPNGILDLHSACLDRFVFIMIKWRPSDVKHHLIGATLGYIQIWYNIANFCHFKKCSFGIYNL